jgi:hypothetical protein
MAEDQLTPLKSDVTRQAVPVLKGYSYQIWQSIYHWINLKADEVLVLEGAEDFDILGPGKAETVQTKDTKASGTVTLNSDDIIDAIAHFWQHQKRNISRTVYLRFLTTSERGMEKDPRFTIGKGLDYWDQARRTDVALSPLKEFFRDHKKLPETVKKFIVESSDEEVRERLIKRIAWDTGREPKEFIETLVDETVCYYGSTLWLQPSESRKVIPHLLRRAWDVACRDKEDERVLRRIDFMDLFEEATTERVGRRELNILLRQLPTADGLVDILSKGDLSAISPSVFSLQSLSSPLPDRASRRKRFVSQLIPVLNQSGKLIIKGSTGMGKSTIAKLITENVGQGWGWLQLRGLNSEQSTNLLYRFLATGFPASNLVIEDIDLDNAEAEAALAAIIYAVDFRGTLVIATTSSETGFKIRSIMRDDTSIILAPSLSDEEIQEVLDNHGCPADFVKALVLILFAKTKGHPQLIHAEIRRHEQEGWPKLTAEDLLPSKDIGDIRQIARKRLFETLPSEAGRILAYRLSIFPGPFTRDHAIKMAEKAPSLQMPGELFDLLVGPWVERLGKGYYRMSPLLLGSAAEVWSSEEIKALYFTAAEAMTVKRKITSSEASNALLFAIFGGADSVVFSLTRSLLTQVTGVLPRMANEFLWMIFLKMDPRRPIYPSNAVASSMLRQLQFVIAAETDHGSIAVKVSELWEREIETVGELDLRKVIRFLFLCTTILRYKIDFSVELLIERILEVDQLSEELEVYTPDLGKMMAGDEALTLTEILFLTVIVRCKGIDALKRLLLVLGQQPPGYRAKLLSLFLKEEMWASILVDHAWLLEAESQKPRWEECMEVYDGLLVAATSWGAMSLVEESFHAMMVIEDEYRGDPHRALEIAQRAEDLLGRDSKIIQNAKAMVMYRKQSYKEAIRDWSVALPKWKGLGAPMTSFTCALKSAAAVGEWEKAAEFALLGEAAARRSEMDTLSLGFRADFGFVLWKARDRKGAVENFALVLDGFSGLPIPETNVQSYLLQKRVGHAITWFLNDYEQDHKEDHAEPPPGSFSDLRLSEDEYKMGLKDYPIHPEVFLWFLLADLDTRAGWGTDIFEKFDLKVSKTKFLYLKFERDHLRILRGLKNLDMKSLIGNFERFFRSQTAVRPFLEKRTGAFVEIEDTAVSAEVNRDYLCASFVGLVVAAIILMVSRGRNVSEIVSVWIEELAAYKEYSKYVDNLLRFVKESQNISLPELIAIVRNGNETYDKRAVAAAFLSVQETLDPGDRFYANIVLFSFVVSSMWKVSLEEELAKIFSGRWLVAVNNQPFSLVSPLSTGPSIIQACRAPDRGIKKMARVLLAARRAVQVSLHDETLDQLIKAAI